MSDTVPPDDPQVPGRRPRRWRRWVIVTLSVVLVAVLGVGGFAAWSVTNALSGIPRENLMPDGSGDTAATPADQTPNLGVPDAGSASANPDDEAGTIESGTADPNGTLNAGRPDLGASGSLNYLLLGSDSRGSDQGRSDVMILAHVSPARDKVYLISFTRDMWVTIPGRGSAKIHAAYSYGGVPLAVRTVENLIGTRIDHAVKIDFNGFAGLTDALGGVTVNNQHATEGYPQGEITISGQAALAYVRDRKHVPGGDLGRAERQRAVVTAILSKVLSADVLANPAKFNDVASRLGGFFTVDSGLTNDVIFQTATSMRVTGAGDIVSLQAPIAGFGRSNGGQAINLVDWPKMKELADAIHAGTMSSYRG